MLALGVNSLGFNRPQEYPMEEIHAVQVVKALHQIAFELKLIREQMQKRDKADG